MPDQVFSPDTLKPILDTLLDEIDYATWRAADPVELVWAYDDPGDRELVAWIASTLAYGRVSLLKEAIAEVLEILGPRPLERLLQADDVEASFGDALSGFVYRMTRGVDVLDMLAGLREVLRTYQSLEDAYLACPGSDDHLARASFLVRAIRAGRLRDELQRGLRYLMPDPADGGACKRLHLFMRWVVRGPDAVDLGLWARTSPAVLRMPLDTHTSRICRYIGLTSRRSNDGKAVDEISASLRQLDPDDPMRFDFALCHLGISGSCIHRRSPDHCPGCPIEAICTLS